MRGRRGKGQSVACGYKGRVATCRDEKSARRSGRGGSVKISCADMKIKTLTDK